MSKLTICITLGVFCFAYQAYVTCLVVRAAQFERLQKALQIGAVWLFPLIGALLIQSFIRTEGKPPYKPEKGYTEPGLGEG